MTYHVDLLLDDERRSASPINLGLALRVGAFVVAGAILLMILLLVIASRDVTLKEADARGKWEHLKHPYAQLTALRASLAELRASHRQLDACHRSRLAMGAELAQLQLGIPAAIQLTSLRIHQFVGSQKAGSSASRSYEMRLSGRISGDNPKGSVDELMRYLSSPAYTGRVEAVSVPVNSFRKETVRLPGTGETRTDWFFELVCRYRPRSFE